uniref:Uncharacterized protein n=1 Tax=Meloidogyne enterolobii TaxID=390850 RepID=A0A6V7VNK8_MELEN|nr:unnamed protein product [Meloidogyne enterolobii]
MVEAQPPTTYLFLIPSTWLEEIIRMLYNISIKKALNGRGDWKNGASQ